MFKILQMMFKKQWFKTPLIVNPGNNFVCSQTETCLPDCASGNILYIYYTAKLIYDTVRRQALPFTARNAR